MAFPRRQAPGRVVRSSENSDRKLWSYWIERAEDRDGNGCRSWAVRGQSPHSVHERFPNSRLILELHTRETGPKHLSPQGRHLWSFGPFLVKWEPSKSHHKDLCSPEEHSTIQSLQRRSPRVPQQSRITRYMKKQEMRPIDQPRSRGDPDVGFSRQGFKKSCCNYAVGCKGKHACHELKNGKSQ